MSNNIKIYPTPDRLKSKDSHVNSMDDYRAQYQKSIKDMNLFWSEQALTHLTWITPFTKVFEGDFSAGDIKWFSDGQINVSYNCVDRHALSHPDRVAILWEQDEPGQCVKITYAELLRHVSQTANALKSLGVKKGDIVAIYMPMIPQAVYSMLACARIGAVHNVVFAGFSSDALRDRINDSQCKILITSDIGKRGSKQIKLKQIADEALVECPSVKTVLVYNHNQSQPINLQENRDIEWNATVSKQPDQCPCEVMSSEDPLFILYTSGSTGKPKGVLHTQAGYLLGANITLKNTFDLHPGKGDIFGCVADVGWITGHSYIVYGPLSNGLTTVLFESVPTYPNPSRYWQMIETHKITHFYTSPTAVRALKRLGDDHIKKHDLSSLKVIGSVGEPISPETWIWLYEVVGQSKCAVVDTYWQTETGSFVIAPMASATALKPGSATYPQFGISPVILNPTTGQIVEGNNIEGVLCFNQPWPSMARTIFGDHQRFRQTYFNVYKGYFFTGDGVSRDDDGYYWIKGRVDDVINVSGHRMSTAEIESALVLYPGCAESAVVGINDDITGQAIVCFAIMKSDYKKPDDTASKELIQQVRHHIGPFATPKRVIIVSDLPKTRSGKIMRRILRKISSNEQDQLGDLSTLADPSVIPMLIKKVNGM